MSYFNKALKAICMVATLMAACSSGAQTSAPSKMVQPVKRIVHADADAIARAVWQQITAIESGDAQAVFSGTSPELRAGTSPESLLGEAQKVWPIKLGIRSATLGPAKMVKEKGLADGSTAIQTVKLKDMGGSGWLLAFVVSRQADARWTISAYMALASLGPKGQDI